MTDARIATTSLITRLFWTIALEISNILAIGRGLGHRGRSHDKKSLSAGLGRIIAILYPDFHFAFVNLVDEGAVDVIDGIRLVGAFVLLGV